MGLYAQGLGYSTLNTVRSALSAILRISDCQNFGSHPFVIRFMKGVFETRKPKPNYDVIWDASKVLTYLSTLITPCKGIAIERFDTESSYVAVTSHWPERPINTLNDAFGYEVYRIRMSIPNT